MKTSITIHPADAETIKKLIDADRPPAGVPPAILAVLRNMLTTASVSEDDAVLETHVGFRDRVTLVNPADASDWYQMEIVPPEDADVNMDRISICHPMSLAVFGRKRSEEVEWDTGHGIRHMRIKEIGKSSVVCA